MNLEFKKSNMNLEFKKIKNEKECSEVLKREIYSLLKNNKKVLWLLPGGSNIKIAVDTMNMIRDDLTLSQLDNLAVTLTDERYGNEGHKDSNWQQLKDAGFNFNDVNKAPVLLGLSFEETVQNYSRNVEQLFSWADIVVGQFGIGGDGHIAGVLPNTVGVTSRDVAVGYESDSFTRITLTLNQIKKINKAYAFVLGESKKDALTRLKHNESLSDLPSEILKQVPESHLLTDLDI